MRSQQVWTANDHTICVYTYITLSERLCLHGSDTRLSQRLFPKEEFWLKPSSLSHAWAVDFSGHGPGGVEIIRY